MKTTFSKEVKMNKKKKIVSWEKWSKTVSGKIEDTVKILRTVLKHCCFSSCTYRGIL